MPDTIPGPPAYGQRGSQIVDDAASGTGDWFCLMPLEDVTFSSMTGTLTGYSGVTFPKGIPLFGRWTAFTVSGAVMAYKS